MPQVERATVKARAARLREVAAERRSAWLDGLIGSTQTVLVENGEKGHADNFAMVHTAGIIRGVVGSALITSREGDHLIGTFE